MLVNNTVFLKISAVFLLTALLFSFSSCAYFNAFYNARRSYNNAVKIAEKSKTQNIPATAKTEFENAIEKASRVLQLYPGSRWTDDALMLIGKSFFYIGQYPEAQRKFEELFTNYPDSKFVPEARSIYARTLLIGGKYELAEIELNKTISSDVQKKLKSDAYLSLADLHYYREDYDSAIDLYRQLIANEKDKGIKSEAQLKIAEIYFLKEEYAQAMDEYRKVNDFNPTSQIKYLSEYGEGNSLEYLEEYDEAIERFSSLLSNEDYIDNTSELLLAIARCWDLKGDAEKAIFVLKRFNEFDPKDASALKILIKSIEPENIEREIADELTALKDTVKVAAQNTARARENKVNNSPEALYYIAELYLERYSDIVNAKKYFTDALKAKPSGDITTLINERITSINNIEDLSEELRAKPPVAPILKIPEDSSAQQDSTGEQTKTKEQISEESVYTDSTQYLQALNKFQVQFKNYSKKVTTNMYRIAEIYLTEIDKPDSAFKYLDDLITTFPDSPLAAKALFLQIDIAQKHNLENPDILRTKLLDTYADTDYARFFTKEPVIPKIEETIGPTPDDSAKILFEKAESDLFAGKFEIAIENYQNVLNRFPDSDLAPKSLYAIAWIYEYRLERKDEAISAYDELYRKYKDSDIGRALSSKLDEAYIFVEGEKRKERSVNLAEMAVRRRQSAQEKAVQDSIMIENRIDALGDPDSDFMVSLESDTLVATPAQALEEIVLEIPDSLIELGIEGFIDIKVLIRADGTVGDSEIYRKTIDNDIITDAIWDYVEGSMYSPALDHQSNPVSSWILRRIFYPIK